MNKLFYSKLAASSIKKNSKTYLPYILTCICTIAMYYIMNSLSINDGINGIRGADMIKTTMSFGTTVIAIFSVIFLFYTNSFLIKRRKKEFGLFNILGMEKKHIAKMISLETLYIAVTSLVLGLLLGVLLSKLMYLLLLKIIHFDVQLGFDIPLSSITSTLILFGGIFVLILLNTLRQIHLTKPIELLKGGEAGEKEPKTKWIMSIIGAICLFIGYYLSVSNEDPIKSLQSFFTAVLLVIIGTYCLFTAGSIAFLKMLRKNKNYYYKSTHFISVSGMIYRMKQNAVGLANICILSTAVLVMISTTVTMYVGMEKSIRAMYPRNIIVSVDNTSKEDEDKINNIIKEEITKANVAENNVIYYSSRAFVALQDNNSFSGKESDKLNPANSGDKVSMLNLIPLNEYNRLQNTNASLKDNEILLYGGKELPSNTIKVNNIEFNIKEKINELTIDTNKMDNIVNTYHIIVPNDKTIENLAASFGVKNENIKGLTYYYGFDTTASREDQIKLTNDIKSSLTNAKIEASVNAAEEDREQFLTLHGGLFFLGIFLGLIFIMATVLIIYYKQISEGYDDKKRFEIMQKVGMSKGEVRKSIRTQVLTVFFIPLVASVIHIAFAFNIIRRILILISLPSTSLFVWCTIGTIIVFGILYAIVYALTARVYYKIVS